MAQLAGRRVRPEAAVGIAVGIVALTAVAAMAVGGPGPRDADGAGRSDPPGRSQSEWARDHHGPPPWAHGPKDKAGDHEDHGKHPKPGKREKHHEESQS